MWRPGGDTGPADAADAWLAEHEPTGGTALATSAEPPRAGADVPDATAGTPQHGWRDDPTAPPTTGLLLRHGQTALSVQLRFSGIGDPPLTDYGRASGGRCGHPAGRQRGDGGGQQPAAAGTRDR